VFKQLVVAAILAAPCAAFAGQAMSIEEGFAIASNASTEIDTVMSPMQDGGASDVREPGSGRGVDDADTRTAESASARSARAPRATAGDSAPSTHAHKAHNKTPWQSLVPGALK